MRDSSGPSARIALVALAVVVALLAAYNVACTLWIDLAAAFYTSLIGSRPTGWFDPPGLLFFDLDGTRLLLERGAPPATVYVLVPDVPTSLDALRDTATVTAEPHVIFTHEDDALGPAGMQEWQAFVTDPEGNTVGLVGFVIAS